uniref:Uncharacterized protein n=1 Tax=Eptatretus burgeri TaxID=7764 RepID=A0A8C4PZC1_EPTBU
MEYKVKVLLAIFAFGTFSCGFLNSMVNRQNGFNTSDRKVLLSIFGERKSETGFIESCPTDMTGSSRLFGFFKWLFSWGTCKSIRNNKSPWFLERFNASIQHEWPLSQPLSQEEFRWWNTRQSSGMSYKKLQTVLMQIQKLMPNKTQLFFKEKKEGQCVTCAVVGNSQNVIGSGLGKFIDCHDYVFSYSTNLTCASTTTIHLSVVITISLKTVLYIFSRSTNPNAISPCTSNLFSTSCLSTNIPSVIPLLFLSPSCSFPISISTLFLILPSRILSNTFFA